MNKKSLKVVACLGLAQLALITSANAQEIAAKDLNEVVVTATRTPKKVSEIGKVLRVISQEQLSKSQGRTLPEVLNNVAGLLIGGNGIHPGDLKSVYLRGTSSGNTLILLDGIPVNDASGISGQYDISAIAIEQIERIEILKGGNSTLYGSDAVAGVINIITKKGNQRLTGTVLVTGGSNETYKQSMGLNGSIQKTTIGINMSNLDSKGFSTAAPRNGATGFDDDEFTQHSISANVGQQVSTNFNVNANLQLNQNKSGLDGGAFTDALNDNYIKTSYLAGVGAKYNFKNGGFFTVNASQNNVKNTFESFGDLTKNSGDITNLDAVLNTKLASFLELTSGINYKYSETEQVNPYSPTLFANDNIKSVFTSLFFSEPNGFHFELGGRYNDHSQFGDNFTYTINPSYLIFNKYKIFANISSAFKTPSLYQLFSQYGNLSLKPETSKSYEAGFDVNLLKDKMNLSFSYFRREIKDVIDFGTTGYINQDQQKDKGFELEAAFKPSKVINLTAFYAYVTGDLITPTAEISGLSRRPKNTVGANLGLTLGQQVSLNFIYKWNDKSFDRYYDTSIPPYGATVTVDLKAYQVLDTYIQYKPVQRLTFFADVKNILNENYVEFVGYTTLGRNFNAGLRYEIK